MEWKFCCGKCCGKCCRNFLVADKNVIFEGEMMVLHFHTFVDKSLCNKCCT